MVNRDYTKEVGLKSGTPRVSWPLGLVLLALGAAGLWFGVDKIRELRPARAAHEATVSSVEQPAGGHHASRK